MALNSLGLGFVFTAKDLASATMRRVEGRFQKLDSTTAASAASFHKSVGTMITGLGVLTAGVTGLGLSAKAAGAFGEFDASLAKLQGRLDKSAEDMALLQERAIEAGLATEFSPTEAVAGLEELGAKGLTTTESMQALTGVLDMAAAGNISVARSAATVTAAMGVFGKSAEDAALISDQLLKVTSLTALSSNEMELAMGNLSRGVSQTNQQFEEMLVLTGLVRNTGVDTSVASSSISSALLAMAKNKDKFRALGIEVTDSTGKFRKMSDVMIDAQNILEKKFPDAADRAANGFELFTKFGLTAFGGIMKQVNTGLKDANGNIVQGAEAVADYIRRVEGAEGFGARARTAKESTLPGQLKLLQGTVQTLAISLGEAFADVFLPVVKTVRSGLNALITMLNSMPKSLKTAIATVLVVGSAIVTVAGAVLAGVAAFSMFKAAVVAFAGPILVVGKVLAIATAGALLLGGAFAVIKGAYDKNIGGLADKLNGVGAKVTLFFDAIKQLTTGDGKLRGGVLRDLVKNTNAGVLSLVQRFAQVRHRVKAFFTGLRTGFESVMATADPIFSALGTAVQEFFTALGFGSKALDLITTKSTLFHFQGSTLGEIIGDLTRLFLQGLVVAIRVATGAVHALGLAWKILSTAGVVVIWAVGIIVKLFTYLLRVFTDVGEASLETGSNFDYLAKVVGFGIGIWVSWRAILMASRVAMLAYRGAVIAVTLAQRAYAAGAVIARAATAHPVAAAALLGVALGTAIDQYFGISDAMADYFVSLTKEGQAVEKLEKAYRKTLKVRGQIAAFDSIEAAAKAQGKNVLDYADERATKIAGEQRAQELGLSKEEIKRRLLEGQEVFQNADYDRVEAEAGVEVIRTAQNGEADKAEAAKQAQADAFEQALARANKGGKPIRFQANLNIDKKQVAQLVKEADAELDALDFEADLGMAGG